MAKDIWERLSQWWIRKSKLLRLKKVEKRTGNLTKETICSKLEGLEVKTLTSDNGKEFSEHEEICKEIEGRVSIFVIHTGRVSEV